MKRRAVFLDRDGVLNKALVRDGRPFSPQNLSELEIVDGALIACQRLKSAGFLLICVTNQPDVGRGWLVQEVVEGINRAIQAELPIDDLRVCYHDDADQCICRKPAPGMLIEAARTWDIDLAASYMIGDRWKDIAAGHSAGSRAILIDAGYQEVEQDIPDFRAADLSSAVDWILQATEREFKGTIK